MLGKEFLQCVCNQCKELSATFYIDVFKTAKAESLNASFMTFTVIKRRLTGLSLFIKSLYGDVDVKLKEKCMYTQGNLKMFYLSCYACFYRH